MYYYKAFARNSLGYYYGEVMSFTTNGYPKFIAREYIGGDSSAELYAKFETYGRQVIEAGFLFGYNYYTSVPTINNHSEIVRCEIINNTIRCKHPYDFYLHGFYCRPYFILDNDEIYYGKDEYIYSGKTIKE